MHLDAAQVARVLDRDERTARRVIARIEAVRPDAVAMLPTGGRDARVVALDAVAEHLRLTAGDVLLLAA